MFLHSQDLLPVRRATFKKTFSCELLSAVGTQNLIWFSANLEKTLGCEGFVTFLAQRFLGFSVFAGTKRSLKLLTQKTHSCAIVGISSSVLDGFQRFVTNWMRVSKTRIASSISRKSVFLLLMIGESWKFVTLSWRVWSWTSGWWGHWGGGGVWMTRKIV